MRDPGSVYIEGVTPSGETRVHVRFAGLILDPDACTVLRDTGQTMPLTRGEFALLRFFVKHPGRVLSRDTLLEATAGRRLEPFDRSIDVMVGRLRRKIEPDPKAPRLIVTVPGDGYKFGVEVREGRPTAAPERQAKGERRPSELVAPRRKPLAVPDKPSIAVLPFQNMSGDPQEDYFADGMVEDIVTGLSRIKWLFVIARNSSAIYKGRTIDVRQVDVNSACAICWRAACERPDDACASPSSLSRLKPARISGLTSSTASSKPCSACRITSPSGWSALSSRACRNPRSNVRAANVPRASMPMISI
jgi:DNA-binding winged helix-turn-helix (wHTH) protein